MGGINGTPGIIKLVTFILATVTFGLSFSIFTMHSSHIMLLAGTVFGGFFWFYLVAFIGMVTGNDLDSEASKTWAIYGCIAYFGAGLRAIISFSGSNHNDGTTAMICGIFGLATSVLCFLDGFFAQG